MHVITITSRYFAPHPPHIKVAHGLLKLSLVEVRGLETCYTNGWFPQIRSNAFIYIYTVYDKELKDCLLNTCNSDKVPQFNKLTTRLCIM